MKFSLFDVLTAMTILTVVAVATCIWHRWSIENGTTMWRDMNTSQFAADRESLITTFSPFLSVLYASCAVGFWLSLRTREQEASGLEVIGFSIPILTAPFFPEVPIYLLPGYPVMLIIITICVHSVWFRRFGMAAWLALTAVAWFVLAAVYVRPYFAIFGD